MAILGEDSYPEGRDRRRHSTRKPRRREEHSEERDQDEVRHSKAVPDAPALEELRRARAELYTKTPEERRRREEVIRASYISESRSRHVKAARTSSSRVKSGSVRSERKHRHQGEAGTRRRKPQEDGSDLVYVYTPRREEVRQDDIRADVQRREDEPSRPSERHRRRGYSRVNNEGHPPSTSTERRSRLDKPVPERHASATARQRTARPQTEEYQEERRRSTVSELSRSATVRSQRADAPRLRRSSSMRTSTIAASIRPPLKRSSTTTRAGPSASRYPSYTRAALPSVKETAETASISPSTRDKRRSSGLIGLFGSRPPAPEKKVDCLTCGADDVPVSKSAKLACGHRMCHDCLKRIFNMSVTDPQHMPPKCCTDEHIPLRHVDRLFDTKFKILWNKKYQEYSTKNRIYCPTKGCGEWISPSNIHMDHTTGQKGGKCSRCKTKVCVLCNGTWHNRKECPKDEALNKFVEIAKESGWQRCFNCKAMVELKEGCNHMTCRCTAEFCMICGLKWKTCDCPWFTYETVEADRLNHMNIPEPIRILYRRVAAPRRATPERGYQDEMDRRREQERTDEELARRLQLLGMDDDDNDPRGYGYVSGLRDAAAHLMSDDFVQNATHILTAAFGQVRAAAGHHLPYTPIVEGRQHYTERQLDPFQYTTQESEGDTQPSPAILRRRASKRAKASSARLSGMMQDAETTQMPDLCATATLQNPYASEGMARIGRWLQEVGNDPADVRQYGVVR